MARHSRGSSARSEPARRSQPQIGPILSHIDLSWQAATDPTTPSSQIVYDIYYSATPGGENYSKPTWTTAPGATHFTVALDGFGNAFFVVRARDRAGLQDHNTVQRMAVAHCSRPAHVGARAISISGMQYALPDGTQLNLPAEATGADAAAAIGPGLARAALAVKVDDEVRDLGRPLPDTDGNGAPACRSSPTAAATTR